MRAVIATLIYALIAIPLGAQTATDSARQKAVKVRTDSIRAETCRGGKLSASGLSCSGATATPRVTYLRRHANAIDSILRLPPVIVTPPPPPTNQPPVAAFTVSWSGSTLTLDGRSSTDDQGVVSYLWKSPGTNRPDKTGAVVTRAWEGTAWTEWLIVTDSAGLADTTTRQILGPPATPTPPDTTTPAPPPPPPPTGSMVAELPRAVPVFADPFPGRACAVTASPSSAQSAITAATDGAVICLTTGQYPTLTLPSCSGTGWKVLRAATIPVPEGTRIRPSHAASLPQIRLTASGQVGLKTSGASCRWYIAGLHVHVAAVSYAAIQLGDITHTQLAQVPADLILSRVLVTADAVTLRRCLSLHSSRTAVVDSWLGDCHEKGADSQAIWGGHGPGPYLIHNNHLEGAGENILFGGDDPRIPGLIPSDITITQNHFYKPYATWGPEGSGAGPWTEKNLLELKNAARVRIHGNVFDGSWGDGQSGGGITLMAANQSGNCRWCTVKDITFSGNHVRNVSSGLSLAGRSSNTLDSLARRIAIVGNVLDVGTYGGDRRAIQTTAGVSSLQFIDNVMAGTMSVSVLLEGAGPCTFAGNVIKRGQYGFIGASGTAEGITTLNKSCGTGGWSWSNMTLLSGVNSAYPTGTLWVSSESASPQATAIRAAVTAATAGVVVPP
jgi:hypothetical protein